MSTTQHIRQRGTIPAEQLHTLATFVFPDGRALTPTEIAVLRIFAAAGIRSRCVVAGTHRAPDAAEFRAALFAPPAAS